MDAVVERACPRAEVAAVSSFSPRDDRLHYSDGSHRWLCPGMCPTREQEEAWSLQMHAHRDRHRAEVGLPPLAESRADDTA